MTDALANNVDSSFVLPSSPDDRRKIKSSLQAIADELHKIDDMKSFIKDTTDDLNEKFKIPKKLVSKLARTIHKHDYDKQSEESELFRIFYEEVVDKTTTGSPASNLNTAD